MGTHYNTSLINMMWACLSLMNVKHNIYFMHTRTQCSKLKTNIMDGYLVVFSSLDEAHCWKSYETVVFQAILVVFFKIHNFIVILKILQVIQTFLINRIKINRTFFYWRKDFSTKEYIAKWVFFVQSDTNLIFLQSGPLNSSI